jgi:hypothetical protein
MIVFSNSYSLGIFLTKFEYSVCMFYLFFTLFLIKYNIEGLFWKLY